MEKLVYLLIGSPDAASGHLIATLRGDVVDRLREAGARRIQVNVADESLGHPFGVEPDEDQPQLIAAVSTWVSAVEGSKVGAALPPVADLQAAWHGYLVTESEPMTNEGYPPGPGGRVPGFAQLVALNRPDHLSWAEWRRVWQGSHTAVAIHTQSSFRYVQNVVVRPLTPRAPGYAAVVEECFPIEAATDLHVFFDAVGDEAKLSRHMAAMSESCDRFMDGGAPVAWTTEYLFDQ